MGRSDVYAECGVCRGEFVGVFVDAGDDEMDCHVG